ncbi:MAG TPA: hypothetical protein VKU42_14630, partial [Candidatus Angelobacter sp.]|nr:hypothetical protein [Candidatus Angelobacter sp.]
AVAGELLFHEFTEEATLEKSFPIPAHWTRAKALDPHPRVPHAFLWLAVDPWGDGWIYRELWPSKCCLRWENGKMAGSKGNVPEDDNRFRIKDYILTVKWLESAENDLVCADGQPESAHLKGKPEHIYSRVIDYAARGFFDTTDSDDERNMQQRYEDWSVDPSVDYPFSFDDAIKDRDTGIDMVNDWLRPRMVEMKDGEFKPKSKLHIFEDKCPELIHQLKTNRHEPLTAAMADKVDPQFKPRKKRNHLTDCLRYLAMANIVFVKPANTNKISTWSPIYKGVAY